MSGVYAADIGGPLTRIADNTMGVAGPVLSLYPVHAISMDGGRLAFGGLNSTTKAIYSHESNTINVVADANTPIPSGTGTFALQGFSGSSPSADGGMIAFVGRYDAMRLGVYLDSPSGLARVADTTTSIPNETHNFETFGSVVLSDGQLTFTGGTSSKRGIYLYDNASKEFTTLTDTTTPIPGRVGNFLGFSGGPGIDLDDGQVAFLDSTPNYVNGAYIVDSATGVISTVVAPGMAIPDGDGRVFPGDFNAISIDNSRVVVQYAGIDRLISSSHTDEPPFGLAGVYGMFGGSLEKVLAGGDMLDGRRVATVQIGPESLHGDQIALLVSYVGADAGIYVATLIPEPGTLALIITACGFIALVAYRRSRSALPTWT